MAVALFMDQHVPRKVTDALRERAVDVITAFEDGADQLADPALLDRASQLGRVLVTHDKDFLIEAAQRQRAGVPFAGVIFSPQIGISVSHLISDLELIAKASAPADLQNRVVFLPL